LTAIHRDILDAVIVGQGLAGTTLAWHLFDAGWRIAIVDDDAPVSASKVSAGLLTPIMGKRFTRNDGAALAIARTFYQRIETRTGARFFRDILAARVLADESERDLWARRGPALQSYLLPAQPEPLLPADIADPRYGGFVMQSAQLDVAAYLAASRLALPTVHVRVDPHTDVLTDGPLLHVADLTTRRIIFCEGFAGARNPYFPGLPYQCAKGDVLFVRLPRGLPAMSIHRRMWMAPTAEHDVFRVGATFEWDTLDHVPTAKGRAEIEAELNQILTCRYDVVGQLAGVRPILRGGPRIGASRIDPRIFMFNGLGTKGATRAPFVAAAFAQHLLSALPIPSELDSQSVPPARSG
jgi:glycine/D-amino acid oxidase-like deaminating enzyme